MHQHGPTTYLEVIMASITLAPAPFLKGAVIKQGAYSHPKSVRRALERMQGFKSQGALHAHRYNGQHDGTSMAPPASGGSLPREYTIPATAVYVVFSYLTPIAWVDHDGVVTIPDVKYSATTTHHQTLCRVHIPQDHQRYR